jgi:peptide/nickel transport system substrate-binding protein
VDLISDFPVKDYERLKTTKGVVVGTVPGFEIEHMYYNNKKEPFNNKYLRLAVSHAIDRQVLIDQVFYGLGTNTFGGPISAGSPFFNPKVKELMYFDKQKAKEYLKMAGKPDGFEFTLLMTDEERFRNQGIIIQSQLKDIGIKVNLSPMEKTAFFDNIRRFNYDAGLEDWLNLSVDRDTYLYWNYHSEGAYNWCGYNNPEIDKLLDKSRAEYDLEKRKALFMEIQSILTQDQPMVWLSYRNNQEEWGDYVQN